MPDGAWLPPGSWDGRADGEPVQTVRPLPVGERCGRLLAAVGDLGPFPHFLGGFFGPLGAERRHFASAAVPWGRFAGETSPGAGESVPDPAGCPEESGYRCHCAPGAVDVLYRKDRSYILRSVEIMRN